MHARTHRLGQVYQEFPVYSDVPFIGFVQGPPGPPGPPGGPGDRGSKGLPGVDVSPALSLGNC